MPRRGPGGSVSGDWQPPTKAPVRRSRWRSRLLIGAGAGLVIIVLAAVGFVVFRPDATLSPPGSRPAPTGSPKAPLSPVLADAGGDAPVPAADAVAAALQAPLADTRLGKHVTMQVTDVLTNTLLYQRGPAQPSTPASTMKLATTLAVLKARGPAYQIPTRVLAGANPGEVVLVGGGDPTLAATSTPTYPGAAKLSDLAAQVKRALGGTAPTKVLVDSSLFTGPTANPRWAPADVTSGQVSNITALMADGGRTNPKKVSTPSNRFAAPDLAAGQAFAKLLGLPAAAVSRGSAPADSGASAVPSTAPGAPGALLGAVKSPPLLRILEIMLTASDNVIAEMLSRQVALATNQPASFAGGAAAVVSTLTELGVPMTGVQIYDGSGLAKTDRLTAATLTGILCLAAKPDQPRLHGLFTGLPVAGYSGTLSDRYQKQGGGPAGGAGVVRAKTGTLTGVNTLAGFVVDGSGRLLAFAVMADQVTAGPYAAEAALDRVAESLAALT
jgi:D-alanyl-D-alanine carboxypeptidase/D-alanyl-D-alanine-endopeptidase (penicillin-binding protein 4)